MMFKDAVTKAVKGRLARRISMAILLSVLALAAGPAAGAPVTGPRLAQASPDPEEPAPSLPGEAPPPETPPPAAPAPVSDSGDASSGRAALPKSDLASSAYAEAHFYAMSDKIKANAGRLALGARVAMSKKLMLGLEMVLPWVSPEKGDDEVVFSNLAISMDARVFGNDRIYGLLGLKIHFPVLGEFESTSAMMTDLLSFMANPYEIGFYLPYTMTLRPDFKLYCRLGNFVVGAELGFDFLIATSDEKVAKSSMMTAFRKENFILNWHFGSKLGYLIADMFFPFFEITMSKMAYISDGDASDAPVFINLGPGVQFQYRNFDAGFTVQIPTNGDVTEALNVAFCAKAGGRF